MDLVMVDPSLSYKGGAQRVMLEVAKRFNPIIYTTEYEPKLGFPEFSDFDVRVLKSSIPAPILQRLTDRDKRVAVSISSAWTFLSHKIRDDYDVINANVVPSEWIRARNERVCWCCYSPIRGAFDKSLYQKTYVNDKSLLTEFFFENYRQIERHIVPKIEKIFTISPVVKTRIEKFLNRYDTEIIYPGVDLKKYRLEDYKRYFFYPSRFIPEKRMEMAIRAFKLFARKGWKLTIAGFLSESSRDRQYLEFLREIAKGANVEFIISPSDSKMRSLYSNCYATLFCAIDEDWGLIPIESMAASKPCISVNEGGPQYSIVNNKTGYLVNSVDEMAEKMKFLVDHLDECEKMGGAGRKRVEQNYTWKIFLDKVEEQFKETARMG